MGYLYSMLFLHRWLFHPMFKVNIVSKDQDAADNPKDPDSILWKIMFALESLPEWMRGEPKVDWVRSVTDHTLSHKRNGSVIPFKPRWLPLPEGRFQLWFPPELLDYRKQADVVTKRSTNKPGYWTQKRSELLGPYREALMEGQYVNPDAAALEELRQYSIGLDGEPFHNGENQKDDPTGAKKAHADRVVVDAVGWIAALDFGRVAGGTVREALNVMNVTPGNAPLGSYAWRRREHLAAARKEKGRSRW